VRLSRLSVVVALAIAIIALLLWWPSTPTAQANSDTDLAEGGPVQEVAAADDLPPQASPLQRDVAPAKDELATPIAAESPDLLILVVDDLTGKAVPGAEIRVVDGSDPALEEAEATMQVRPPLELLLRQFGQEYQADETGHLLLQNPPRRNALFAAYEGERVGVATSGQATDAGLELRIASLATLHVRVQDQTGRPLQDQQVVLRQAAEGRRSVAIGATTDEQGLASLTILEANRKAMQDMDWELALAGLGDVGDPLLVDLAALPEETLTLVAKAMGTVEVRVLDEQGKADSGGWGITLREAVAGREQPSFQDMIEAPALHSMVENGVARFPQVGLGLRLSVEASSLDGAQRVEGKGDGPIDPETPARLSVFPTITEPILVGRLLDADGNPLRSRKISGSLNDVGLHSMGSGSQMLRTDGEGGFRYPIRETYQPGSLRQLFLFSPDPKRKDVGYQVVLDLSQEYAPGLYPVGDQQMALQPAIATGVVLDEGGAPVVGVALQLQYGEPDPFRQQQMAWRWLPQLSTKTDADGRFTLRGTTQKPSLRIAATHPDFLPQEWETKAGATGLRLTLARAVTVRGHFLLPLSANSHETNLLVFQEGERPSFQTRPDAQGGFHLDQLPPKAITLVLQSDYLDEELWRQDLSLAGVDTEGVLDLGEIDLRPYLHVLHLHVLDQDGKEVRDAIAGSLDNFHRSGHGQNPLLLLSARPSVDVEVSAEGFRPTILENLSVDQDVVLQKPYRLQIQVDGLELIPEGFRVDIYSRRRFQKGITRGSPFFSYESATASGTWFDLPYPGGYELKLLLRPPSSLSARAWNLSPNDAATLIDIDQDTTEVKLTVFQGDVDRVLAEIDAQENR